MQDDETGILAPGEVLFVGRQLQGNPPIGVPVGAATVGLDHKGAHVVLAGGTRKAILPIFETICAWARGHGSTRLFAAGRAGWDRLSPMRATATVDGTTYYELELL